MTRVTLEVHLTGDPEALARACGAGLALPPETVIITEPLDQDGLYHLLQRLSDLGIELREFRPVTAAAELAVARGGGHG